MKFSEQWLREWVNPAVSTEALAEQLTMAGLEVDAIEPVAADFSQVVVGRVLSVAPHPQADRLQICQVDVGQAAAEPLAIVCGARNVRQNMQVPTALIGAQLPGGLKIKQSKLRGVESYGMLCSAAELGLAEKAEGLLVLDEQLTPGQDIRQALQLDDVSIELGLTPNRSDCLGIAGIAREVGVLNRCAVTAVATAAVAASSNRTFPVSVSAAGACPRYLGRVISGIKPSAVTPLWLQERLRRSGLRSISPVVDVTNYVMLELGQPMHAFDLAKLSQGIAVRMAQPGESIQLLDEQQLELTADSLVIADGNGPVALAGIMGGLASAVTEVTTELFLESAFFTPAAISGKARQYGLHTDSSHRFERGVDPEGPRRALERATRLLLDIVGGQAGEISEVASQDHLPQSQPVALRASRLQRLLGMEIPRQEVSDILQRLGMDITLADEQQWHVSAPSFRFDISMEADLIEEVARVYGYSQLPVSQPVAHMSIAAAQANVTQDVRQLLVARGYQEAISYSFVPAALQQLLDPEQPPIALANPLSPELAVMRTSLWPGLIQAAQYNLNRQQKRLRLFESGVKFIHSAVDNTSDATTGTAANKLQQAVTEEGVVAGLVCGPVLAEQWGSASRPVDFYDIKNDVEALLAVAGTTGFEFVAARHPALHPGQTAMIQRAAGDTVGWLGLIHPAVASQLSLTEAVYMFELNLRGLQRPALPAYRECSRYPAIRRDIAIVVAAQVTAQQIRSCIAAAGGDLLQEITIFDIYTGKGVDSGAKSMAIGLTLQDFSRTLTDDEVETLLTGVLTHLKDKLGATLRE